MRDALGGTLIITIIAVFVVFASAYLAYNVNYQKAFRMKNKIISIYEKYNGDCNEGECNNEIETYAQEIGYDTENNFPCDGIKGADSYTGVFTSGNSKQLYCVHMVKAVTKGATAYDDTGKEKCYYQIVTKINIRIPIVDNVIGTPALYVTGDTKVFEKSTGKCV